jgi:hypothetical protein
MEIISLAVEILPSTHGNFSICHTIDMEKRDMETFTSIEGIIYMDTR